MAFEDQNPNETIYQDQAIGSAGQATTAKLRVQIQGVTIGEDTLTLNFTDSVSGTFDATTGTATIPITPGAQQAPQWSVVGRISTGIGALENIDIALLEDDTTPSDVELLGKRTGDGNLVKVGVGNLPTGGGGEVNLGANVGTGIGTFDGKVGVTLNMRSVVGEGVMEVALDGQDIDLDLKDTSPGLFVGRETTGAGKPTFVVAETSRRFRADFQNNIGQITETGTFTLSGVRDAKLAGSRGHYKAMVKLENPTVEGVLQLPDPGDAQFANLERGLFCHILVASGSQPARITALVPNTLRAGTGYSESTVPFNLDTYYFGYSQASAVSAIYELHLDDVWRLEGPLRQNVGDDLTLDGPQHGGGGTLSVEDGGVEVVAAASTLNFTGAGVTASDAGMGTATINIPGAGAGAGAYGTYIVPSGSTGAAFLAAVSAADAAGVGVRLQEGVAYNWGDIGTTDLTGATKLHVWGPGPDKCDVIVGGTAKNVGQRRLRLHRDTRWEGITFKDSALCFTFEGNTGRVEETEFIDCRTSNVGNLLHHELDVTPSGSMNLGTIRLERVLCENVRDGVHCRLGAGVGATNVPVDRVIMTDVVVDDWQRYGLNIGYDGPPTGGNWPTESLAQITNCIVRNSTTTVGPGFAFEFTACKSAELHNCWALDNSIGAANFDHEAFYTKNFSFKMIGGGAINHEQRDFQGIIGLKGKDTGVGDNSELGHCLLYGVTVVAPSSPDINAVFIQRDKVTIDSCFFECANLSGSIIGFQNGNPMRNIEIVRNRCECGANFNPGIVAQSDVADLLLEGNTWITQNSGAHQVIRILSGSSAGQDMVSPRIHNEKFIRQGSGAMTAIDVDPRTGGVISNVDIWGCHFFDVTQALEFSGDETNATGTHRIRGCRHTGLVPTVDTAPSGGNLDNALNTF